MCFHFTFNQLLFYIYPTTQVWWWRFYICLSFNYLIKNERKNWPLLPLKDLFLFARRQSSLDMSHDNHHCYLPSVICETTYCWCRQKNAEMEHMQVRLRPHVSRNFWIRNFFFPDSKIPRPHVFAESGIRIRNLVEFLNMLWIRNRVDAKSGYLIRWRNKIEPRSWSWILYSRWQPNSQVLSLASTSLTRLYDACSVPNIPRWDRLPSWFSARTEEWGKNGNFSWAT